MWGDNVVCRAPAALVNQWVDAKPTGLYDLSAATGEKTNLADQNPQVVAQMRDIMTEAFQPRTDSP